MIPNEPTVPQALFGPPSRGARWLYLIIGVVALIATILAFGFNHWDLIIQDGLYSKDRGWWIDDDEPIGHFLFHLGPKILIITLGVFLTIHWWRLPKNHPQKQPLRMCLIGMILVPVILTSIRNISNVYCPKSFDRYGGKIPYTGILEPAPECAACDRPGKCFPAAHASAGFCLMGGFFAWTDRKRWLSLAAGLGAGWIMGFYQMAKGAHFLSHTLVSMLGAWVILAALSLLLEPGRENNK